MGDLKHRQGILPALNFSISRQLNQSSQRSLDFVGPPQQFGALGDLSGAIVVFDFF